MLQWFTRFPELAEFTEFSFHLGKTPLFFYVVSKLPKAEYEVNFVQLTNETLLQVSLSLWTGFITSWSSPDKSIVMSNCYEYSVELWL